MKLFFALYCICAVLCSGPLLADTESGKWGDQGDGTFRNPIIAADYSDPDVIRVGKHYYMVASTFETSPGITVLESSDLVNWMTIGAAFPDLSKIGPDFNWDHMGRYGEGFFAPSIRYHAGKFWVFVNCHSGEGFQAASATNPAGPWTDVQIVDKNGKPLRTRGWTDPCPFWDDNGKAYLASSRPGAKWYSYLFQMTPDGRQLLDADVDKMNVDGVQYSYPDGGTLFSPFHSSEGNKIYKRNGYYYLFHIEFLDSGHGQGTYVLRSRNIYGTKPDGTPGGPGDIGSYDLYKFGNVTAGKQDFPGQGGLVDTPDGRWFYVAQYNNYESDGRRPCLIPVTWIDDWPVPGVDIVSEHGTMAWQLPKPIPGGSITLPLGSDDFDSATLSPMWQWNHQPRPDMWSLSDRRGYLRLHAFKPLRAGQFFSAGNTICQRYMRSNETTETVKLDINAMTDGEEAGLAHFNGGRNYATIGIRQTNGSQSLVYTTSDVLATSIIPVPLPSGLKTIWLRSDSGFDNVNSYSYSIDGKQFTAFGASYNLRDAAYRGDFVGLYNYNDESDTGYVDIDWFHYSVMNR